MDGHKEWRVANEKLAADRERRRIRRAQRVEIAWIHKYCSEEIADMLDAATRARRGR